MELLAPMLEKFGPTGLTIIMMGGGLVYLTTWLRQMADKNDERHDKTQEKFLNALDMQRKDTTLALKDVVEEFKSMHEVLGNKVDELTNKVDQLRK